ncbi:MAG: nitrilase-related carbon-nitrogen hydrolase, partial [Pyrinomonadaceae bacterium]
MAKTTIACVQMDCEIGNVVVNRRKIVGRLREAAGRGARISIFPECALTGYCFDSLEEAAPFAEHLDGPSAQAIAEVCREAGVYAVVGFIERDGEKCYNAAMMVGPQ